MPDRSPHDLWETALGQLELQVTRPNFETWLRNTVGLRMEGSQLIVGVPSDFAVEWLRSRMGSLTSHTASQLAGNPISVSFEVVGAQPASARPGAVAQQPGPTPCSLPLDLNPRFTFESFTVVQSNRLAYRASRRVAAGDTSSNPLVLCGPPGLGKTHLLHAIAHQATQAKERVVLLTAETFVDRYSQAARAGQPHSFRDNFADCQLLLLDDVQFLASRPRSQDQFFHIFNSLHLHERRLVLTAAVYPAALDGLSLSLRSRLQAGLTVELRLPPTKERLRILQAKSAQLQQPLSDPVLQFIAQQPYQHIRQFEGAFNRVVAYADLTGGTISLDFAREALHLLQDPRLSPSPDDILHAVSKHLHLSPEQLSGPSRARDITYARHIAMYLLRHLSQRPLTEIGRLLGGRDHSTVLSGYQRIKKELSSIPQTSTDIQHLESALQNEPAA